jgi:hypothetical protein
MLLSRFAPAAAVAAWALLGGPGLAADCKVTGTVHLSGQPLATGKVIFHLDGGQFVGCKVKDGRYAIDRVPVGTRRVTVEGPGVPPRYGSEDASGLSVEVREGTGSFDFEIPK